MKALSLIQPWASLVTLGAKRIETRSWQTRYRGPLAIHASKGFPSDCRKLVGQAPFYECLGARTATELPLGAVLGVVWLTECLPTDQLEPGEPEKFFGDFTPGRFGWFFEQTILTFNPRPVSGARGLWDWEPPGDMKTTIEQVTRRLSP